MAENPELKGRVRDFYFSRMDIGAGQCADEFGLSIRTVEDWILDGNWSTLRRLDHIRRGFPEGYQDQAALIQAVLLSRIVTDTGIEAKDLKGLIETWRDMAMSTMPQDEVTFDRDLLLDDETD